MGSEAKIMTDSLLFIPEPHRSAVAPHPDRPLRVHDHPRLRGQPDGHLCCGAQPHDEDCEKRVHRELGHLRPDALSHHHAIDPHRDTLPDLAVRQYRGRQIPPGRAKKDYIRRYDQMSKDDQSCGCASC